MARLSEKQQAERRARILDAAEQCVARDGFQGATMQAIAREAGIALGATYLYFPSKAALIAGLVERQRSDLMDDFAQVARADDVVGALIGLARKHLVEEPCQKAKLVVAIWAESTRDPEVAALCNSFDQEIRQHLRNVFSLAQQQGIAAANIDLDYVADLLLTLVDGQIKRRSLEPDFDAFGMAVPILRLALAGAIQPPVLPAAASRSLS
jgi:AcrR family transcriptional regulator